jgi:N-acetylglucosamine-6-phosphate deacetylase
VQHDQLQAEGYRGDPLNVTFSKCRGVAELSKVIIRGGSIVAPDSVIEGGTVTIENGVIVEVAAGATEIPESCADATVIDATGCVVCPGFIDIHIHGAAGADTMDASPEALYAMARFAASRGVTGFLPTVMSSPLPAMVKACEQAAAFMRAQAVGAGTGRGAAVLGINVEGPFLSQGARGAQPAEGLLAPDMAALDTLLSAGAGAIRCMSVAPELNGALDIITALVRAGVTASIAHTEATYDQTVAAVRAGASLATHTFNAMRGLHHREPGTVGAALTQDGLTCEMIADGVHLHPAVVALIVRAKGSARVALITDAMRAAGMGEGRSELGGQAVTVKGGEARLDDGTLAGSILTLDRAFANARRFAGASLAEAAEMASTTPARVIGLANRKGRIAPGMDGDITILATSGEVVRTIVAGNTVYEGVLKVVNW